MLKYGKEWATEDHFVIERGILMHHQDKPWFRGKFHHYKEAIKALAPWFWWHRWSDMLLKEFCEQQEVIVIGPGASGKTTVAAMYCYVTYQIWPKDTAILVSSTTVGSLNLRVWGEIKGIHKKVKERRPLMPGRVIESKKIFTNAPPLEDGVDHRDGIIGLASKSGGENVGLQNHVGIHKARMILLGDELSLMPLTFLDPVSNLRKNAWFQLIGLCNPKDRLDAAGRAAEPEGGWDSLGEQPETRKWKCRISGRVGIQLCGYDTPNGDFAPGLNPFPGLITPEQIERDRMDYGEDSIQFRMMNLGVMPKVSLNGRVITVQMCESNRAFDPVVWGSGKLTDVLGVDASYSTDHGDRTACTHLRFGRDANGNTAMAVIGNFLVSLVDLPNATPEQQITLAVQKYCMANSIPPENMAFDSTGRGTLANTLAREWSVKVNAIEFGGPAPERPTHMGSKVLESDAYFNRMTGLWYTSRKVIEAGQMRQLPREYAEEASMRDVKIVSKTKVQVEPKSETKKRLRKSPDLWDSLVVAIEMARIRGFEVAGMVNGDKKASFLPKWLTEMGAARAKMDKSKMLTYA